MHIHIKTQTITTGPRYKHHYISIRGLIFMGLYINWLDLGNEFSVLESRLELGPKTHTIWVLFAYLIKSSQPKSCYVGLGDSACTFKPDIGLCLIVISFNFLQPGPFSCLWSNALCPRLGGFAFASYWGLGRWVLNSCVNTNFYNKLIFFFFWEENWLFYDGKEKFKLL